MTNRRKQLKDKAREARGRMRDRDIAKARLEARKARRACTCREPKPHRDCAYCGCGGPGTHICGVCKEEGIDGPVIRGTERRVCSAHKEN